MDITNYLELWYPVHGKPWAKFRDEVLTWFAVHGLDIGIEADASQKALVVHATLPDDRSAVLFKMRWL